MEHDLISIDVELSGLPELRRLLLKIEQAKKIIRQTEIRWLSLFGDLKVEQLELSIQIIRLRKEISWIVARQNAGIPVDEEAMEEDMKRMMAVYTQELKALSSEVAASQRGCVISDIEQRKIRRLYRQIAKAIHPDLHPDFADDDELSDLWIKAVTAYELNDPDLLETVAIEVNAILEKGDRVDLGLSDEQIEQRIEKARKDLDELYRDNAFELLEMLEDPKAVEETRRQMKQAIDDFKEKIVQLEDEKLKLLEGDTPVWQMN